MNDLKTCMGNSAEELNSWLLSVKKVSTLTKSYPKENSFNNAERNLPIFLYSINLKGCSWFTLMERMRAEFSRVSTSSHTSVVLLIVDRRQMKA